MVQSLWGGQPQAENEDPLQTFHNRTRKLHSDLSLWHSTNFGEMDRRLDLCRKTLLFFDKIEERRQLMQHEFSLRLKIREKAYELALNIELKWKQRSRCLWLAQGDRNTRYFHAMASSRLQRNLVLSIHHNGQIISDPIRIRDLFCAAMEGVLGTSTQVLQFDATALYNSNSNLDQLQQPFSLQEIQQAVFQLANGKASGPDGLPNEFLKMYWPEVKDQILLIFERLFNNSLDLTSYNEAKIVMIPKCDPAATTSDFRPISVLNLIPKLISKVLANRLRVVLPDLISRNQTCFIQGRQIAENFVTTRELLQHITHEGKPVVFAKIDFKKAFDSIEWSFLTTVLQARGFPNRWIQWLITLWSSSSSRVLINGEYSSSFAHKRGLRQGDPLSPMLFNIGVDVFQKMIQVGNSILSAPLSNKLQDSMVALQYADDTAIIANGDITSLVTFKLILRIFSAISGLQVNYSKSTFVPLGIDGNDLHWVQAVMGCSRSDFPITYLGMPLTVKKPTKQLFIPLIEKVEGRLQGWQSRLLSRGGRLLLTQTVLSSIPIYHMICFVLPKWVISRIDRARRRFIWGNRGKDHRYVSLYNWNLVCIPRRWGGLGIPDLHLRNVSLIMRWWWKLYNEPESIWSVLISRIRWQGTYSLGPFL